MATSKRGGARGAAELIRGVRKGDPVAASRALTHVVDETPEAEELLAAFFKASGKSQKIGVCGPPGAGKSTLTGRLIAEFRKRKLRVGILAVDPSSSISGGAFLGDRLRIMDHALDEGVFIRSLATRGMVGGVSHTIFGAIHVLEAFGCDKIIVETVGTGQDEVMIAKVVDTVLYVTTPQMGDEIQAMKAGVMEIGDVFVVNKADLSGKDKAVSDLRAALGLGHAAGQAQKAWDTPICATIAATGEGVAELAKAIDGHWRHLSTSDEGRRRLKEQHKEEVSLFVSRRVYRDALKHLDDKALEALVEHRSDPTAVAAQLLKR